MRWTPRTLAATPAGRRRVLVAAGLAGLTAFVPMIQADNPPSGERASRSGPGSRPAAAGLPGGPALALTRYPYLTDVVNQNATSGYATVNWATNRSAAKAVVRWGTVGADCVEHTTTATAVPIVVKGVPQYQWKATLAVRPDTRYCYRVYLNTRPETDLLGSDPAPTFASQLAAATTPFTFAVFGDWGKVDKDGTNVHQANLLAQIAASGARFVVSTGDTGYPAGTQDSHGDLHQTGPDVSAVFGPRFWRVVGASLPLFSAVGNHDPNNAFIVNWPQDQAAAISGGHYGMDTYCCLNGTASKSYASAWYAFDAGGARFYVLDAAWEQGNLGTADPYKNDYDYHWAPTSPQYQWLSKDLAAHPSGPKFAFFHYPLYSDQTSEPSNPLLQGAASLEGLLSRHGVDIGFSGHAHIYQRNLRSGPDGLVSYVTGGGGAKLQSVGGDGCSALDAYAVGFSPSTNAGSACGDAQVPESPERVVHYLLVRVEGTQVTVTPTDELGRTFDVVTYDFGADGATAPDPVQVTAAAAGGSEVRVSWSPGVDDVGVNGYRIFRDGSPLATVAGHIRGYSDRDVESERTYSYEVEAFDGNGLASPRSDRAMARLEPGSTVFTFSPSDDATVDALQRTTNYGALTTGKVDGDRQRHFLLKFPISGLNGCTVTRATLRLSPNDALPGTAEVRRMADAGWSEERVNWANAPGADTTPVALLEATATGFHEAAVTPLVAGDGILSLRVTPRSTDGATFSSKEERRPADHRPQLVVECRAP